HRLGLELVEEDERPQFRHHRFTSSRSSSRTIRRISSRASSTPAARCGAATGAASGEALHGSRPVKSPKASEGSDEYATRVTLIRWRGSRFSPSDERPKKPVPIVIVGARFVSSPAEPVLPPTLTA